jgi:D-serine deaminase-like pyridoxal phosphate-dependent protein
MKPEPWWVVSDVAEVLSPSLLLYVDRVEENIRRMIGLAGDASRLRPHIKTHKLPEIVRLQLAHGITRFKCATLAEAEMAALAGAVDVLLAYQPVGPNI